MSHNNNQSLPHPRPVQGLNAQGQVVKTAPVSIDAEQLVDHPLYRTFPNSAPSAAGEVATRLTIFGRWVHGFPVDISITEEYEPTYQDSHEPSFKYKNVKGNPPRGLNGQPISHSEWDKAFNRADTEIRDWYEKDQKFTKEESYQLRKEDRTLGITRAQTILTLKARGILAADYFDDPVDH